MTRILCEAWVRNVSRLDFVTVTLYYTVLLNFVPLREFIAFLVLPGIDLVFVEWVHFGVGIFGVTFLLMI